MPVPPYTTDTSSEAEQVQLALIRAMSPSERVRRAMQLTNQLTKGTAARRDFGATMERCQYVDEIAGPDGRR